MFLLFDTLTRQETLGPHQIWVLFLLLLFSFIFTLAAKYKREGATDMMLVIIALHFWSLAIERMLIAARYEWLIYTEYDQYYTVWTPFRHLSLLLVELPLYGLGLVLLSEPIKKYLRSLLKGWLDA